MLLGDDVLKVPSSQATEALEAASMLLDWYKEDANNKQFIAFTKWLVVSLKGTVSRYIDKNRTGACGLGRNRRLLRHTELVFLSTVCARRVVLVLFTNNAVN